MQTAQGWLPGWMEPYVDWLALLGIVSGGLFVVTVFVLPFVIARMPADYFVRPPRPPRHPVWRVVRTGIGAVLVAAGVVMLFVPGQGVLTILAGLGVADFPGKRRIELWIVRRRSVTRALQWLRRRRGRPPLVLDRSSDPRRLLP